MFDFENKPVKDWTLAECKEYCENKRNKHNIYCSDSKCILRTCDICSYEPKYYKILPSIPKFTSDEIAYCRLIKKNYSWAKYIARSKSGLKYLELQPVFTSNGYFGFGKTGEWSTIDENFFPQIKPLTYYAIDDIIKQGETS